MTPTSPQNYSIPRKIAAAGALLMDEQERVLLVNPTYKPQWEIPGGVVEAFESPSAGCTREIEEEIGLQITPGELLGVDFIAHPERDREVLRFIFWGGVLSAEEIAAIRLPGDELSEFGFFDGAEARRLLSPTLGEQVNRILAARAHGHFVYTEHPITQPAPE